MWINQYSRIGVRIVASTISCSDAVEGVMMRDIARFGVKNITGRRAVIAMCVFASKGVWVQWLSTPFVTNRALTVSICFPLLCWAIFLGFSRCPMSSDREGIRSRINRCCCAAFKGAQLALTIYYSNKLPEPVPSGFPIINNLRILPYLYNFPTLRGCKLKLHTLALVLRWFSNVEPVIDFINKRCRPELLLNLQLYSSYSSCSSYSSYSSSDLAGFTKLHAACLKMSECGQNWEKWFAAKAGNFGLTITLWLFVLSLGIKHTIL